MPIRSSLLKNLNTEVYKLWWHIMIIVFSSDAGLAGSKSRSQLYREQGSHGRRPLHEQRRLGSKEEMKATVAASPPPSGEFVPIPTAVPWATTQSQEALCAKSSTFYLSKLNWVPSLWPKGLGPRQIINTQIIRVIVSIHQWWPVSPSLGPCGYLSGFSNPACIQADLSTPHLHFPRGGPDSTS